MARDQAQETALIAVTTTANYATFEGGIQQAYLTATADCFVDFDAVATNQSLLIKANQAPVRISLGGSNVQKVYAITATGTANLYILGVRGRG
jgi:hypothetical protein